MTDDDTGSEAELAAMDAYTYNEKLAHAIVAAHDAAFRKGWRAAQNQRDEMAKTNRRFEPLLYSLIFAMSGTLFGAIVYGLWLK